MNIIFFVVVALIGNCIVQASPVYLNSYNNRNEEDFSSPGFRQLGYDANSDDSPYIVEGWNGQDSASDTGVYDSFGPLQRSSPLSDYNQQNDKPEVESRVLGNMGWSWNKRPPKRSRRSIYHRYSRQSSDAWLGGLDYNIGPFDRDFDNVPHDQYEYGNFAGTQGYRRRRSANSFTMKDDQPSNTWVNQ